MSSCIIVGSGPGVSESIAYQFGSNGYKIGLIARNAKNLKKQCERLLNDGIETQWSAANAGDVIALEVSIHSLMRSLGGCDVLIYNAAVLHPNQPLDISTETISNEFSVNLLGAHRSAQIVAPEMIRKKQGAILFTGGGLALEPYPEWTSLALGKAALRSLSFSLFKSLAPKGVHVSVIAICGIVKSGSQFDPQLIAEKYWQVATNPNGLKDREIIYQPEGSDPFYNDPNKEHLNTSILPAHITTPN